MMISQSIPTSTLKEAVNSTRTATVKHVFFIAETKGTMDSLDIRPIEKAKISCARKLFNDISKDNVLYHDVDSYQKLLNIMMTSPELVKKRP